LRYESFYPFARNQSPPPTQRQQGFGFPPPFPGAGQNFGQQNPSQGQNPGQSAQGSRTTSGPGSSKMDSYMATANQFMNTAQQFAPVVQQFAPMVRNIPAMWRLYKGFQSLPSSGEQATTGGNAIQNIARSTAQLPISNTGPQPSVPKIFQPPV